MHKVAYVDISPSFQEMDHEAELLQYSHPTADSFSLLPPVLKCFIPQTYINVYIFYLLKNILFF